METVLITGGTGLIGMALSQMLVSKNYRVVVLTRKQKPPEGSISYATWDPGKMEIDRLALSQADHIIHLAGAGVADKRWTKSRKKTIVDSRVNSGKLIAGALAETNNKVQSVVSASGIGWYGPDRKNNVPFVESDPAFHDFLGHTCVKWENSLNGVKEAGKRLVILRTGIVLSNKGGAFVEFKKPFKAGIAAILGSGTQAISWIHIDDICRAYVYAIENHFISGVYNATAPDVVSNRNFMLKLAKARNKPYIAAHVPEFALKIALGEMSIEVLKSATVDPGKLRGAGFNFIYPTLDAALNQLLKKKPIS